MKHRIVDSSMNGVNGLVIRLAHRMMNDSKPTRLLCFSMTDIFVFAAIIPRTKGYPQPMKLSLHQSMVSSDTKYRMK